MFYTDYSAWKADALRRPQGLVQRAVESGKEVFRAYAHDKYDGDNRLRQIGVFGKLPGHGFLCDVQTGMYFYRRRTMRALDDKNAVDSGPQPGPLPPRVRPRHWGLT